MRIVDKGTEGVAQGLQGLLQSIAPIIIIPECSCYEGYMRNRYTIDIESE
jgi:hypothetical protein